MRYFEWAKQFKGNCNFSDVNDNERHSFYRQTMLAEIVARMENLKITLGNSRY